MYWMPEDNLEKRIEEDKIPYDQWVDRGLLRLCKGNKINYKDVTAWFVEMQDKYDIYLMYCGYDSWSAKYWVDDMSDYLGNPQ
jgi:Phage terminase-like protein, large subunit